MNVLLVNPYQATPAYIQPNLGLGYLAGSLLQRGHQVTYLDCPRDGFGPAHWATYLDRNSFDVIGIQLYTFNYANVRDMLAVARRMQPKTTLVCGGPHVTVAATQTLQDLTELDYGICGEGEAAFPALLAALQSGSGLDKVPSLVWRNQAVIVTNPLLRPQNLDDLPPFPWHLMPPASYPMQPHGVLNKGFPIAPLVATRGCPCACTFCSAGAEMGRTVRRRSPTSIVDEIELLVRKFGVNEIHFEDDNFTLDRDFALAVCNDILSRDLKVAWACPNGVRLDRLDPELVQLMEQSGCYSVAVGIESGSERMLKRMKKGLVPDQVLQGLAMIHQHSRIRVTGFFLLGHPGETLDDLETTRRFLLKAPLDRISLSPFMPLPGTQSAAELIEQGKISATPDWPKLISYKDDDYVSYCELPGPALLALARRISLRFYLRPRIVLGILGGIHSLNQVKILFRYLLYLLGLSKARHW